jgi:outer membrane protein OmpA-like peptidoglycan-associated protein
MKKIFITDSQLKHIIEKKRNKKIVITDSQLKYVIENLKKKKQINEEVVEEGLKEFALAGLMTLASLTNIAQVKDKNISQDKLKAAEYVQKRLEKGDLDGDGVKDLKEYFDKLHIEMNEDNLKKLKSADVDKLVTIKTTDEDRAKKLIEKGYVLSDVKIDRDTTFEDIGGGGLVEVSSLIDISNDGFKTGSYELSEKTKQELDSIIKNVKELNGEINNLYIESSTDKEPIKIGNEKLAKLRANAVKDYILNSGVKVNNIEIKTLPEQGPDIYTKTMSKEEREQARKETKKYRYVKVNMDFSYNVANIGPEKKIKDVVEKATFYLIKKSEHKPEIKKDNVKIKIKNCKIKTKTGKDIPCPVF